MAVISTDNKITKSEEVVAIQVDESSDVEWFYILHACVTCVCNEKQKLIRKWLKIFKHVHWRVINKRLHWEESFDISHRWVKMYGESVHGLLHVSMTQCTRRCVIRRYAFAVNSAIDALTTMLDEVVKIVKYIKSRQLNSRI